MPHDEHGRWYCGLPFPPPAMAEVELTERLSERAGINDEIEMVFYQLSQAHVSPEYRTNAVKSVEEMRRERDRIEAALLAEAKGETK
ncbi:MAG: hypothetical protein M3Q10_19935 [Chloroflexota bacterium]|nr:hypothetical protein [Chloroflexota bacterium]